MPPGKATTNHCTPASCLNRARLISHLAANESRQMHTVQRGHNREPCFFAEQDYFTYLHGLSEALGVETPKLRLQLQQSDQTLQALKAAKTPNSASQIIELNQ